MRQLAKSEATVATTDAGKSHPEATLSCTTSKTSTSHKAVRFC